MSESIATPLKTLHTERREAARLGFSVKTLQGWRLKGDGPPFLKIGPSVRYDPTAVDAWLNDRIRTNNRTIGRTRPSKSGAGMLNHGPHQPDPGPERPAGRSCQGSTPQT
jgi:predicted DNA-binding transcriptional regulator AlpA